MKPPVTTGCIVFVGTATGDTTSTDIRFTLHWVAGPATS